MTSPAAAAPTAPPAPTSHVDLAPLLAELESERALGELIRTRSKDVDALTRALSASLNRVHSTPASAVPALVRALAPQFALLRARIQDVVDVVPEGQSWRWCDAWSFALQRGSFCAGMAYWLSAGELISKEQAAHVLGISAATASRLTLTTEEYLHSLISMINEFPRLAINAVTMADYATPLRLSAFVKDLSSGFAVLNLKNDSLRKRFDSIKYDVKKIEEIVYDISLRGLLKDRTPEWDTRGLGVQVPSAEAAAAWAALNGPFQ